MCIVNLIKSISNARVEMDSLLERVYYLILLHVNIYLLKRH